MPAAGRLQQLVEEADDSTHGRNQHQALKEKALIRGSEPTEIWALRWSQPAVQAMALPSLTLPPSCASMPPPAEVA
jgi:hypothetical protein